MCTPVPLYMCMYPRGVALKAIANIYWHLYMHGLVREVINSYTRTLLADVASCISIEVVIKGIYMKHACMLCAST